MKTIQAIYNHGRWIVLCPKHGAAGAMPADNEYICPACYPKILAGMMVLRGGRTEFVPDRQARETARCMAAEADEIYLVEKPKDADEIEAALNALPPHKRNWNGESLEQIRAYADKQAHLIENYNKRNPELDG